MLIKQILLAIVGLSSGFGIAGGVFAFVISLNVIDRLAQMTHTARHILLYEDAVLFGGICGNLLSIYQFSFPVGVPGGFLFGAFSGIFVGCLAMALAEALNVLPILLRRVGIYKGLGFLVTSLALGKAIGALLQFYMGWTN